ncbi:MAG: CapA family protein [Clostridia bacterium]|nr:CapA family protein [Clostridia bacterium]
MHKKRRGLSLGSILTICLTAAVVAGCAFLFSRIRGANANAAMDAQRMIGAVHSFMQTASGGDTQPQATVLTVTVTLAPVTPPPATPVPVTAAPVNNPYESFSFTLTAGGLASFQSDISDSVYNKTDKTLDYEPVVQSVREKISSDINLVTLPQTINTADRKYSDTLAPAEAAVALHSMGFGQVALATEHILDQGRQGVENTVSALTSRHLECAGVNAMGASRVKLVELNGGTVAILSYTDMLTSKSKNELAKDNSFFALYDADMARADIQNARNQGARCVIVCMYWGKQDAVSVTAAQKKTAQEMAEMGADIILGTRPTRVLPMDFITCVGPDGKTHTAFVAYSLGMLLTESREAYDISGMLLHLGVRSDEQGMIHFEAIEYTPLYLWKQKISGRTQFCIVCSADPPPEAMSTQQKEVMQRSLTRVQTALKDSPVKQRK